MKRGVDKRFDGGICYTVEMAFREHRGWTVRKSWFMVVVVWADRWRRDIDWIRWSSET